MKIARNKFFLKVYSDLLRNAGSMGLTPSDTVALLTLATYLHGDSTRAWPTVQTVANSMGVSYNTAQRVLVNLKKIGAITISEQGDPYNGYFNVYDLKPFLERTEELTDGKDVKPFGGESQVKVQRKVNKLYQPRRKFGNEPIEAISGTEDSEPSNVTSITSGTVLTRISSIVRNGTLDQLPQSFNWMADSRLWGELLALWDYHHTKSSILKDRLKLALTNHWVNAIWHDVREDWLKHGVDVDDISKLPTSLMARLFQGIESRKYQYI